MDRIPVSSSNLYSVGYDNESQILEIAFRSGGVYQYFNVPVSVYTGLMEASSHGRYFHYVIKKAFPYRRVL